MKKEFRRLIMEEEEYDQYIDSKYPYMAHLKKGMFIISNGEIEKLTLFEDLNLKTGSCDRWCNSNENGLGIGMQRFIELVEATFGKVTYGCEGGFEISLEFDVEDKGEMVYFLCAGNKGQEVCMGLYWKDMIQLETLDFKETIKYLDDIVTKFANKAGLHKGY